MAIKTTELKELVKGGLISSIILFIFTGATYLYQNSRLVLGEYERICHNAYDTKVWLDLCFGPYYQQLGTLLWVMKVEVAAIVVLIVALTFLKKKSS